MLGDALGRLFLDLDGVPRAARSRYEQALHDELLELARSRGTREEAARVSAERAVGEVREAVSRMMVDLGPSGDDVRRIRCGRADCPNKVR